MVILKVTKNQGFIYSLEDTFFKKLEDSFALIETSFATISYSFNFFLLICKLCKSGL